MMPITQATKTPVRQVVVRKQPVNFASFDQARKYVRQTGASWDIESVGCGIYVVTKRGIVVGKGLHWNSAIADAESNL